MTAIVDTSHYAWALEQRELLEIADVSAADLKRSLGESAVTTHRRLSRHFFPNFRPVRTNRLALNAYWRVSEKLIQHPMPDVAIANYSCRVTKPAITAHRGELKS